MNAKCRALRQEIQAIREEQNNHYHQILQYGTDTRQEGLVWVLKAIWYLDSNINLSKLPKFLDPLSIHYLFTVCHFFIFMRFVCLFLLWEFVCLFGGLWKCFFMCFFYVLFYVFFLVCQERYENV